MLNVLECSFGKAGKWLIIKECSNVRGFCEIGWCFLGFLGERTFHFEYNNLPGRNLWKLGYLSTEACILSKREHYIYIL